MIFSSASPGIVFNVVLLPVQHKKKKTLSFFRTFCNNSCAFSVVCLAVALKRLMGILWCVSM